MILDKSKYQSRRINLFTGNWDPANWDTSVIDFAALYANPELEGEINRIGDGRNLDPCWERYIEAAAIHSQGKPLGDYHLFRPGTPLLIQLDLITRYVPAWPRLGFWGDLEVEDGLRGQALFDACNRYLLALDDFYGRVTGIYSADWWLSSRISLDNLARWAHRPAWLAGYPTLYMPEGWTCLIHQWTDRKRWPGLPNPADANRLQGLTIEQLILRLDTPLGAPAPVSPDLDLVAKWTAHSIELARDVLGEL